MSRPCSCTAGVQVSESFFGERQAVESLLPTLQDLSQPFQFISPWHCPPRRMSVESLPGAALAGRITRAAKARMLPKYIVAESDNDVFDERSSEGMS